MNSASHRRTSFLYRACLAALCSTPLLAIAQTNAPLTAPGAVAPQAAYAAPAPAPALNSGDDLGITTRGLLAAQADGRRAGPELPILGPVATASWQRYVESFEHPIPEYFVTRVNTGGSSGGN